MSTERVTLQTADGLALEAELAVPGGEPWAAAVLAHPHPQFGGTMRSIVPGTLFAALPAASVVALRFNFRGVEGSEGTFGDGRPERQDVVAAIDAVWPIAEGLPLLLAGWSFGADTSLTVDDERVGGWLAVAPPLRRPDDMAAVAADPRPKLLAVPQHDQYRDPDSAREVVAGWTATELRVVNGADHFLVGRVDRVAEWAVEFARALPAASNRE
ncbi:MAG: Alpha/beta hydrolase [Acidimicrobiales bacterium]|nr:Alpha/beta hydrolase [Acidimicrobiales bacterium]